jgi:hypothetical protein
MTNLHIITIVASTAFNIANVVLICLFWRRMK